MKAFSKEWWLKLATTVIRDCELYSYDNGTLVTFRQTCDWDDEDLIASGKKCAELDGQIKLSKLLIEKIKG